MSAPLDHCPEGENQRPCPSRLPVSTDFYSTLSDSKELDDEPAAKRARLNRDCFYNDEIEGFHSLSQRSEEIPKISERQWLDSDERMILEMMASLEQAIRSNNEQKQAIQESSSASSACQSSCCDMSTAADGEGRSEYPTSESECSPNQHGADSCALSVIDEEAQQILQEAEDQNMLSHLCGSWDTGLIPSRWCAFDMLELDTFLLRTEDESRVVYNPMLDLYVQSSCEI